MPRENDEDRLGGRLTLLNPAALDDQQRQVYEALVRTVVPEAGKSGFTARLEDGRFIGPFNALLRVPAIALGLGQWTAQIARSGIADGVRQAVILTVGAAWSADFEIDAHRSAARAVGLLADAVDAIIAGSRPVGLSRDADIAQRLTGSLLSDHSVPDQLYEDAVKAFSEDGIIAILSLMGQYQTISPYLPASKCQSPSAAIRYISATGPRTTAGLDDRHRHCCGRPIGQELLWRASAGLAGITPWSRTNSM